MSEAVTRRPPRTIPGKLFAVPFAVVVLFLLWLVFSMAVRFQTLMKQLEQTRSAWPAASASLFERYESLLKSEGHLDESLRSQVLSAIGDAKKVTQFDQQSVVFVAMERAVQANPSSKEMIDRFNISEPIQEVIRLDQTRQRLQEDFVGRATVYGLRLKLPPVFDLESAGRPSN